MNETLKVGISTCLLGHRVRYDGGHKRDPFIINTLGKYFQFIPVCPEVECGLPTPRESMRLVGDPEAPRLVTGKTGIDHTERMKTWGRNRLEDLAGKQLCGYIFKSKSPSSGMERIKVYNDKDMPVKKGVGIWARMFMDRFPLLPVEDEGRLHDPGLRENFIERVFVMRRWRELIAGGCTLGRLVDFHTRHKLLIMAHSVEVYRSLGRLVAGGKNVSTDELFEQYVQQLTKGLALRATVKKNVNVLHHLLGYFKTELSPDEKQEMLEVVALYKQELVPLIVPVTLVNHYVRKYGQPYLEQQVYLNPHPIDLKLRTHV